jgi:hypothetical protein
MGADNQDEKTVTLALPDGVREMETVQIDRIGPVLAIRFANGYCLTIDALHLGDHECQAVLHAPGVDPFDEDGNSDVVANLAFGGRPVQTWAKEEGE